MADEPTSEFVADGRKAWGRAFDIDGAMLSMAQHWHGGFLEDEKFVVFEVIGFHGGGHYQVDADDVLDTTWYEVPGPELEAFVEDAKDLLYAREDLLVDRESDSRFE